MTTELEKLFFDTFGIEPKTSQMYGVQLDYHIDEYPQITDRILLELICYSENCIYFAKTFNYTNIEELKNGILKGLLKIMKSRIHTERKEHVKQQVQALFKEER